MQNDCFPNATRDWPKAPVSSLARVNPRYQVHKDHEYPFIEMAAVGENFRGILSLASRKLEGSGLSRFAVGDTLFAKITPCPQNGKVAFVASLPDKVALGSTEFIVLSPKPNTEPRFLYHLLCSHNVRGRAAARMEGSTGRLRVPEEVFEKRLLIPIPPRHEQAAIAKILDQLDIALHQGHTVIQSVVEFRGALIQQFFADALGETAYADRPRKRLPRGWSLVPTGQLLAQEPKNGASPTASSQPPGIPTFSIAAVREGRVNLDDRSNLKYVQMPDKAADKFRIRRGDILIVRGNANSDLVGKAGMVDTFPEGCIYPDITKRVVFRTEGDHIPTPPYAVLAWNHPVVHNQVLRRAKTSNGTLKINTRDVKGIIMPLPPPEAQAELVSLTTALDTKIAAMNQVAAARQALKKSLMHDLLTGRVRVQLR